MHKYYDCTSYAARFHRYCDCCYLLGYGVGNKASKLDIFKEYLFVCLPLFMFFPSSNIVLIFLYFVSLCISCNMINKQGNELIFFQYETYIS